MALSSFDSGLIFKNQTFWQATTSRHICLCDNAAFNKTANLIQVVRRELVTADGYSRAPFTVNAFAAVTNGVQTDIESSYTTGLAPLTYNAVVILVNGNPKANNGIASISGSTINSPGHGLANDEPVFFTSDGDAPTNMTLEQMYYVVSSSANAYSIAASPGGSPLSLGSSWVGTLTGRSGKGEIMFFEIFGETRTISASSIKPVEVTLGER